MLGSMVTDMVIDTIGMAVNSKYFILDSIFHTHTHVYIYIYIHLYIQLQTNR